MDAIPDLQMWQVIALGALVLGFGNLALMKKGQEIPPVRAFLTALAGYLAWTSGPELMKAARPAEALALLFGFLSAPIGWILFARRGAILRFLLRLFAMFLVSVASLIALSSRLPTERAVLASLCVGTIVFLPIGKWVRNRRLWPRSSASKLEPAPIDPEVLSRLEADLAKARREMQASKSRIERLEKSATRTLRTERSQADRLEKRRAEITSHIRALLALQDDLEEGVPRYETAHGFLMLETGRVLRAQIDAGERNPPLELPPFYFSVLSELLQDDDFERRYFHSQGRAIVQAVNRFHRGECPVNSLKKLVQKLSAREHARRPFLGDAEDVLVEGWLAPFRRYQERQFDLYRAGEHPRQSELAASRIGLPEDLSGRGWQKAWDERPWLFAAGGQEPSGDNSVHIEEFGLWNRIFRFWNR
jgi:hypothetical protein